MSMYPKITEQDFFNLEKVAEQQKNQRAIILEKKIF